ncbi:hypothetical protein BT63DRAFT_465133 [Microthyrium microscopicum]|uniref:2EXR domain-containing protein n=1 Tax=Microthyrium microscopicum TaxID=703497 RepID=A0A6A6TW42_9PEZI|nr:hypothetical protein BT63DRAFT_465133 [Microthyrium microscopicum]
MSGPAMHLLATSGAEANRYPKRNRTAISYVETAEVSDGDNYEHNIANEPSSPVSKNKIKTLRKAKMSKTLSENDSPTRHIFPFMKLPPELRNEIYRTCLVVDDKPLTILHPPPQHPRQIKIKRTKQKSLKFLQNGPHQKGRRRYCNEIAVPQLIPKILRICKDIRTEACPMLYSNVFEFESARAVQSFLLAVGQNNYPLLQRVWFSKNQVIRFGRRHEMLITFHLLSACVNIIEIKMDAYLPETYIDRIICVDDSFQVNYLVSMLWEFSGPWFRAIAQAKRNIFAGLEVFKICRNFWEDVCRWLCTDASRRLSTYWSLSYFRHIQGHFLHQIPEKAVQLEDCVTEQLKSILRREMAVFGADDEGSF